MRNGLLMLAIAGVGALPAYSAIPEAQEKTLVVHEWGTFTSLQDSEGRIVNLWISSELIFT